MYCRCVLCCACSWRTWCGTPSRIPSTPSGRPSWPQTWCSRSSGRDGYCTGSIREQRSVDSRWTVCSWIVARLYSCTVYFKTVYSYICLKLFICKGVELYICTMDSFTMDSFTMDSCTVVQVYICTVNNVLCKEGTKIQSWQLYVDTVVELICVQCAYVHCSVQLLKCTLNNKFNNAHVQIYVKNYLRDLCIVYIIIYHLPTIFVDS